MLTAEQQLAAQKANVETLFALTTNAFDGVEKLVDHYQEGHRLLRKRAKDRARRRFLHRVGATRRTVLSGWVDRK